MSLNFNLNQALALLGIKPLKLLAKPVQQSIPIYLGAVGWPTVPDHVSLWGLLIPIRRTFQQYINLRPAKLLAGVESPLRDKAPGSIDFVVVRENSEGEYAGVGGRVHQGHPIEAATDVSMMTRAGVERIMRFA